MNMKNKHAIFITTLLLVFVCGIFAGQYLKRTEAVTTGEWKPVNTAKTEETAKKEDCLLYTSDAADETLWV